MNSNARSGFSRRAGAFALGAFLALAALADSSTLTVGDTSATVTGTSPVTADFTVTRSGDPGYDAYVAYQTADGSAVAGSDYTASSGTVRIPAGAGSATVSVPVLGSSTPKPDLSFKLNLSGAAGVGPAASFAYGGIQAVGTTPYGVVLGDFNGDGKLDVAVTSANDNTVSILINTTAPGATSASYARTRTDVAVGTDPRALVVADFNNDGKPDLAVANYGGGTVSILLNGTAPGASSPSFTLAASPAVGVEPSAIAVGDFNFDGKPDLAVASEVSGTLSILINTTTGAGASFGTSGVSVGSSYGVAVGDFNGDGKPDLAATLVGSSTISILFNTTAPGTAGASFAPAGGAAAGSGAYAVAAGDFNGDGKPDLAVTNAGDGTVSILLNGTAPGASSASFTSAASPEVGVGPNFVAVGDLNGDGRPDLAVANIYDRTLSVLVNATIPGASSASFILAASPEVGDLPATVAIGDLNGDGKPDLVSQNEEPGTAVTLLNTTPGPAPGAGFVLAGTSATDYLPEGIATGDFNGDGKPDLAVAAAGSGVVSILLNSTAAGAANTSFTLTTSPAAGHGLRTPAVGDFNGDGKLDLAVPNVASNTVSILLNGTAPGASTASFTLAGTPGVGQGPQYVAVGDFNGDGKPDLATANAIDGTTSILFNTTAPGAASASFTPAATVAVGPSPFSVVVGDFNGDGKPDLAVANYNGGAVVLLNNTVPGAASASFSFAASLPAGTYPTSVAVGDFNGDGKPDLAVANSGDSNVSVFLNTTAPGAASASFTPAITVGVGILPVSLVTGDYNGDGKPDLAVGNYQGNSVSILFNDTAPGAASPSFTVLTVPNAGTELISLTTGDYNGDGKPDLAAASSNGNNATVLLNTQYLASASASATGTIHTSIPVASLNPSALDFGSQRVGNSSAAQTVQLSNSSTAPLAVGTIAASGDFSQSNDCPASLAPAGQCSISVVFKPAAQGARSGTLSVSSNGGGSSTVALSGTGIASQVQLSAAALNFGTQLVGTTGTQQSLTLSNPGTATLDIVSIAASGDFIQSNSCGPMLAPNASCVIGVSFKPAAMGARGGALTILSDAASSPDSVSLSGTGIAPLVQLSAGALSFGQQLVGTGSAAQSLSLSNPGTATLNIAGIAVSGDFVQAGSCGSTLAPNASCTITVSFLPTASGLRSGALTVLSNAASSPDHVSLSGTGTAPIVHFSAGTLAFGNQYIATTSTAQSLSLSNTGDGALNIASLNVSGDYAQSNNCGATVAPGASCTISLSFTPTAAGARSGTLSLASNAASSPDHVGLGGTGLKYNTSITANPALGSLLPPQLYLTVSAQLQETAPVLMPLAGKPVVFTTSSGQPICIVTTDASGKAACSLANSGLVPLLSVLLGGGSYHANYAGDALYNGSSGTGPLLN